MIRERNESGFSRTRRGLTIAAEIQMEVTLLNKTWGGWETEEEVRMPGDDHVRAQREEATCEPSQGEGPQEEPA